MRRLAVSLFKGGVGKTTTAVNLAHALATMGRHVLLVDTDTQGQAARSLGVQAERGVADVVGGRLSLSEARVQARNRLWLLAGGQMLAGVKREIDRREGGGERILAEALAPAEGRYDYVIVDTAPGYDTLTINVFFYAREVLAPVSLEVLTLQGLVDFVRSVASVARYHRELALRYVLPTFLDGRVRKSAEILEQLRARYPQEICSPVHYSVRLSEAPGFGQTIFEYAPRSIGAGDYWQLAERVDGDGGA